MELEFLGLSVCNFSLWMKEFVFRFYVSVLCLVKVSLLRDESLFRFCHIQISDIRHSIMENPLR